MQDTLVIDRPDQLKALGHPLRLRALQTLDEGLELTNRELAARLGVDPGHLHFHVRMLVKAGLIEPASDGRQREKPYRAVARTVSVAPELLGSGAGSDVQAAMLGEVQRGFAAHAADGRLRSVQIALRLDLDRALDLLRELSELATEREDETGEPIVITAFAHPPSPGE